MKFNNRYGIRRLIVGGITKRNRYAGESSAHDERRCARSPCLEYERFQENLNLGEWGGDFKQIQALTPKNVRATAGFSVCVESSGYRARG